MPLPSGSFRMVDDQEPRRERPPRQAEPQRAQGVEEGPPLGARRADAARDTFPLSHPDASIAPRMGMPRASQGPDEALTESNQAASPAARRASKAGIQSESNEAERE